MSGFAGGVVWEDLDKPKVYRTIRVTPVLAIRGLRAPRLCVRDHSTDVASAAAASRRPGFMGEIVRPTRFSAAMKRAPFLSIPTSFPSCRPQHQAPFVWERLDHIGPNLSNTVAYQSELPMNWRSRGAPTRLWDIGYPE